MGIALLAVSTLAHPLNTLHRWWRTRDSRSRLPMEGSAPAPATRAPTAYAAQRIARHAPCPAGAKHPVRVLRRNPASSGAGRMVIAGRMADVCAELERLAACEPPY